MKTDYSNPNLRCKHCRKWIKRNPRNKDQHYCSSAPCQQSRKNKWEKEKLKKDPSYKEKRKTQKATWRKHHKTDGYQVKYRAGHPSYRESNRNSQSMRNTRTIKIVKTDTIISELLERQGLYKGYVDKKPQAEKIVKTDALIATIRIYQRIQADIVQKTGKL